MSIDSEGKPARATPDPQDEYEPKTAKQAMGYLIEECGEVLAAAGKAQRWGMGSINPELIATDPLYGETNAEWLARELNDLETAIALVRRFVL